MNFSNNVLLSKISKNIPNNIFHSNINFRDRIHNFIFFLFFTFCVTILMTHLPIVEEGDYENVPTIGAFSVISNYIV